MVKKKPKEDSSPIIPLKTVDAGTPAEHLEPAATPEEQATQQNADFKAFVDSIKEGFTAVNTQMDAISKRLTQQDQRIAAVASVGPDDKPTNPMDYLKTITDLLNSPIVQTITDKILGAGEETAPAPGPTVDPAYAKMVMEAAEKNNKYQARWMEAMIQGVELKNAQLKKEIGSDLS